MLITGRWLGPRKWTLDTGYWTMIARLGLKTDELVRSGNSLKPAIPPKAGILFFQDVLDPGFRRGDDPRDFL